MTAADEQRRLVRARAAVFGLFASFGLIIATWAVHLPSIKQATGISASLLGIVLFVLGAGALVGMQISGALIDRRGSGRIGVLGVAAMAIALVPPLIVSSWWPVAAGAFVLGITTGIAEVGINAAAVDVERAYARPIMGSFHAVFSIGNVLGALISAGSFKLGIPILATAMAVAVLALAIVGAAATVFLTFRPTPRDDDAADDPSAVAANDDPPETRRVILLGLLAFLLFLTEGSAMDWSSLHAQQHLGASAFEGALAFGCFVGAMTIGRFSVDRIAARVGPVRTFRWGSATAALGVAIVITSPALPLTLLGWVVLGLGLSGGVPQVFTAAGNLGDSAGKTLSRVVGAGYIAILAGPGVIGWLADVFSINSAFLLPLCAVAICACAARGVAPHSPVAAG